MILVQEEALRKGREQFEPLVNLGRQAPQDGQRIDTVERELMRQLRALGHTLLSLFLARHGDGGRGPTTPGDEGRPRHRLPETHERRSLSIFGAGTIGRVVSGTREGQQIERAPRDERLGLPEDSFSYVLEDWSQRLGLKGSFAAAGGPRETLLGRRLGRRTLEQMNQTVAGSATAYRAAVEPPPAAAEGPRLVVTAEGKGVPMRRPPEGGPTPHHRRTKGEKANTQQRACVGAVDSIEPFVRTAADLRDAVRRPEKAGDRPRPQHKHVGAELSRDVNGFPLLAQEGLVCQLGDELTARSGPDRAGICRRDGERARWEAQRVSFPEAVAILDLFYVLERLWAVAPCFHREGSRQAVWFVEERWRDRLQGRAGT